MEAKKGGAKTRRQKKEAKKGTRFLRWHGLTGQSGFPLAGQAVEALLHGHDSCPVVPVNPPADCAAIGAEGCR